MKILKNEKFLHIVSVVLVLALSLWLIYYRGLSALFVLVILTLPTLILPRAHSLLSFLRCLVVGISLLPAMTFPFGLTGPYVFVVDKRWVRQVFLSAMPLLQFIIPVFCVMFIVAYEIHEKIVLKKYIPFYVVMILMVLIAVFIPVLYSLSFFIFYYAIVVIIADICEGSLYKNRYSLISNLPYIFLYLTAIYRIKG